jgi:hypothetical protein
MGADVDFILIDTLFVAVGRFGVMLLRLEDGFGGKFERTYCLLIKPRLLDFAVMLVLTIVVRPERRFIATIGLPPQHKDTRGLRLTLLRSEYFDGVFVGVN